METNQDKPAGTLTLIELEEDELEVYISYLSKIKPNLNIRFLTHILGEDSLLKFFEVFANKNLKIPSRTEMNNIINYIKIYQFCKERGFNNDTYKKASYKFRKRPISIYRILLKVNKQLGGIDAIPELKSNRK